MDEFFSNVSITSPFKEKGFITVKQRKQQVHETIAGKRSYRLSMKVKAFPSPDVVW
jgi:FMS-like tyrosine kinase 1